MQSTTTWCYIYIIFFVYTNSQSLKEFLRVKKVIWRTLVLSLGNVFLPGNQHLLDEVTEKVLQHKIIFLPRKENIRIKKEKKVKLYHYLNIHAWSSSSFFLKFVFFLTLLPLLRMPEIKSMCIEVSLIFYYNELFPSLCTLVYMSYNMIGYKVP